ncbi:MAG: hypothetical protein LUD81_10410 [Clostridiales bacterium]|nr:hypothetical protein [Clostridiales bacterium]
MINTKIEPLKNITFPSNDFNYYGFIRWLESEILENSQYIENPRAIKNESKLRIHIRALNLSKAESNALDDEVTESLSEITSEGFLNGYLTALAITQGEVL